MTAAEELRTLASKPLTPLGRRILTRHALITKDGHVGVQALAQALSCRPITVWRFLKEKEPIWLETADYFDLVARLCELLRVDHSWLFDVTYYGEMGELYFDLRRRNNQ